METTPPTEPPDDLTAKAPPLPSSDRPVPPARAAAHSGPELIDEIARGGMGVVYRGRDRSLNRDLAVKVLLPEAAFRPELHQRFVEEARIAGQLQHPGIVPVHEAGSLPDHRPYFTMKLVKGQTLSARLRAKAPLSELLPVFESVCQAMAYAHAHGVIHRDLKPANIMVGAFGEVLVMDWGLAKVLGGGPPSGGAGTHIDVGRAAGDSGHTQAGAVMGTPAYMAPEQARGEDIDQRADVFGLGAILCEILTGKPPFDGRGAEALALAACGDVSAAHARLAAGGADAGLVALARDCLAADAAARPRDAEAVAARVASYRAGVAERLRAAELNAAQSEARAAEASARNRLTLAAAGLVVLLAAAVAGGWVLVARQQAAREQDRLVRRADIARRAEAELREAAALRDKDRRAYRDRLQRARALLAEEGGDEALAAEADRLIAEADAEDRDARLHAGLREAIRLMGASEPGTARWDNRHSAARTAAALREWGVTPGETPTDQAAARMRRLAPAVRADLIQALNVWSWHESTQPIDFHRGYPPPHVIAHVPPDTAAARAGVAGGDTLLAVAVGDGPWHDVTGWGLARVRYWLNSPGNPVIRLRVRGPREGDAPREARLTMSPILPWVEALIDEVDAGAWRKAGRRADREPDLARREEAVSRLAADMDGRAEPPWAQVGQSYRLAGVNRSDDALALLRRLTREHPGDFLSHIYLHLALPDDEPGARDERIRHLMAALAVQPESDTARLFLAGEWEKAGDRREAIALLRAGVTARPGSGALTWALGSFLAEEGEDDEALRWYHAATKLEGAAPMAWHGIGLILSMRRKDVAGAEKAFREVLRHDPRRADSRISLGLVLMAGKRYDEARVEMERAARDAPGGASAWLHLGRLAALAGDHAAAGRHLRQAARLARGKEGGAVWTAWAYILEKQGKNADALAATRRAISASPVWEEPWRSAGRMLTALGRVTEAEQVSKHLIGLEPGKADVRADLAALLSRRGMYASAVRQMRLAAALAPEDAEMHLMLGMLLNFDGRFVEAEAALRRHGGLAPDSPALPMPLALAMTAQGRHGEAAAVWEAREAADPRAYDPPCQLVNVYRAAGRHAEMVAAARRAIRLRPTGYEPYAHLARYLLERGEIEASLAVARKGMRRAGRLPPLVLTAQRAEALAALRGQLDAVAGGAPVSGSPAQTALMAWSMRYSPGTRVRACELFVEAFAADPRLKGPWRVEALRAAAGAGGPRWRRQALTWLVGMARPALARLPGCGEDEAAAHRRTLWSILSEASFAPLRGDSLRALPPEEADAWRRLWSELHAAVNPTPPPPPRSGEGEPQE